MSSKPFQIVVTILVVGAGVAGLALLHLGNQHLRQRVKDNRRQSERVVQLRAETHETQRLLSQVEGGQADSVRAVRGELARVREEVAALETKAHVSHAKATAQAAIDAEAAASNRDPEKGVMRLENFQNLGQATPSAAFQTLVWAATQGREEQLMRVVGLTSEARAKAEALLANLPPDQRSEWSAERVGAKFLIALLNEVAVLQIMGVTVEDGGSRVQLEVRFPQVSKRETTQRIPMQRSAGGDWQILIAEGQIERVRKNIQGEEREPSSK